MDGPSDVLVGVFGWSITILKSSAFDLRFSTCVLTVDIDTVRERRRDSRAIDVDFSVVRPIDLARRVGALDVWVSDQTLL